MRILGYCCNGFGHGHLSRMTALLAALKADLPSRAIRLNSLDLLLLTDSDNTWPAKLLQIPIFKLPSKRFIIEREGALAGESKEILSGASRALIKAYRPDILIVDTFLAGTFEEFSDGEIFQSFYSVLVNRERRPSVGLLPAEAELIELMRHLIVPHTPGEASFVPQGPAPTDWVGEIILSDCLKVLSRETVRAQLGLRAADPAIALYFGAGLSESEKNYAAAIVESLHAVSPNARLFCFSSDLTLDHVESISHFPAAEILTAFDGAVSCGSYNFAHEFLRAGIPTALFERYRHVDDQRARVSRFAGKGACLALAAAPDKSLRDQLAPLFDPERCRALSQAARAAVAGGGVQLAARSVLDRWEDGT